jgi:hypothetical protein
VTSFISSPTTYSPPPAPSSTSSVSHTSPITLALLVATVFGVYLAL